MGEQLHLLDNSSEERIETVDPKWLVPYIICLVCWAYIDATIKYIVPSGDLFYRDTYSSALMSAGFLTGSIIYLMLGRKVLAIYFGFALLVVFCIVAFVFLLKNMNISWGDACLGTVGCGLVLFPLLERILKNSYPQGKKQTLCILTMLVQSIFSLIINLNNGLFIHPEMIGAFPFIMCCILFSFAFAFSFFKKPVQETIQHPASDISPPFSLPKFIFYLLFCVIINIQGIAYIIRSENIAGRHAGMSEYFQWAAVILTALVATYTFLRSGKLNPSLLMRTGLVIMFVSVLTLTLTVENGYAFAFPGYFALGIEKLAITGSILFNIGMLAYLIQFYRLKTFVLIFVAPMLPSTFVSMTLLSFNPDHVFSFLNKWFLILTIFTLLLMALFFLFLSRKPKPYYHATNRQQPE